MLSYSKGPDVPLLEDTIPEVFQKTARRFPNHDALIVRHQGVRLTFTQLAAEVERVARSSLLLGDWMDRLTTAGEVPGV
jgi:fatty-acyl-CoA synthase